jgi:hypothetical protein
MISLNTWIAFSDTVIISTANEYTQSRPDLRNSNFTQETTEVGIEYTYGLLYIHIYEGIYLESKIKHTGTW